MLVNVLRKTVASIIFLFLVNCKEEVKYPNIEWVTSTPESQDVDENKLNDALSFVSKYFGPDQLKETIIIRNGNVIFEGDSTIKQHNIYSCSKSLTSTILGLLIEEGKCSLNDKAFDYDPTIGENYKDITLRHFTTMTSGYNAIGTSRWCDNCSEDWSLTPYKPGKPLFQAGTEYCYWDEAQMYFGKVLTIIANEDLKIYLDRKIMSKIGITEWDWWFEEKWNGIPLRNGCTGIQVNAKQLARIGYLFLNKGKWKNEQLINPYWINEATKVQVDISIPVADTDRKSTLGNGRYGYNWWVKGNANDMPNTPDGSYFMSGLNNNVCFVIPKWNMVFVRMGDDYNPPEGKRNVYDLFFKELSKSIIN